MTKKAKSRLWYAVIAFIIFVVEIIIALYVDDKFIRPFGGDILVVILLCCIVRIFCTRKPKALALWVFIFAVAVEVAQYLDVVNLLGLGHIQFFRTIIGTDFSFIDILCYAVGCVIFFVIETAVRKIKRKV
ncbi:MAG: DUF2809 domain-containing protein [Clostridia bacterium]|nr:DUF2809 domain-containing protein [Clostridia bacterium]